MSVLKKLMVGLFLVISFVSQAQKKDLYQESEIMLGKSKEEVITTLKSLTNFPKTGDYKGRERVSWDDHHDLKQAYKAYYFTNGVCDSIAFRVLMDNDLNRLMKERYQFVKKDSTVGKMAIKVLSQYRASSYYVNQIRAIDKKHQVADQYHLSFYRKP